MFYVFSLKKFPQQVYILKENVEKTVQVIAPAFFPTLKFESFKERSIKRETASDEL